LKGSDFSSALLPALYSVPGIGINYWALTLLYTKPLKQIDPILAVSANASCHDIERVSEFVAETSLAMCAVELLVERSINGIVSRCWIAWPPSVALCAPSPPVDAGRAKNRDSASTLLLYCSNWLPGQGVMAGKLRV